jgi:translation initiation factor IF-3
MQSAPRERGAEPRPVRGRLSPSAAAVVIHLIGRDGRSLGLVPLGEAVKSARAQGLDVLPVDVRQHPPVYRMVDWSRYRYEHERKRPRPHPEEKPPKIVQITAATDEHDLAVKERTARRLLDAGYRVRLRLFYRGRQIFHPELGERVLERLIGALADAANPSGHPVREGRYLSVTLTPSARGHAPAAKSDKSKIERGAHDDSGSEHSITHP